MSKYRHGKAMSNYRLTRSVSFNCLHISWIIMISLPLELDKTFRLVHILFLNKIDINIKVMRDSYKWTELYEFLYMHSIDYFLYLFLRSFI